MTQGTKVDVIIYLGNAELMLNPDVLKDGLYIHTSASQGSYKPSQYNMLLPTGKEAST